MSIGNTIKGKLKKIEGKVTGDKPRAAQGKIQETAGKVGSKISATVAKAKMKLKSSKLGRKASAAKAMP